MTVTHAVLSALLVGIAAQTPNGGDSSLFYGRGDCVAVRADQPLNQGERLLILAPGVATEARAGVISKPAAGSERWDRYRGEQPDRVSSSSL